MPATCSAHPADRMSIHSREGRKGHPCRRRAAHENEVVVDTGGRKEKQEFEGKAGFRGGTGGYAVLVIVVVAVMSNAVRNADPTGLLPWEVAWATFRWY